jgi:hypothetical protein
MTLPRLGDARLLDLCTRDDRCRTTARPRVWMTASGVCGWSMLAIVSGQNGNPSREVLRGSGCHVSP